MRKNAYKSPRLYVCLISAVDVLTESPNGAEGVSFDSENVYDVFW